MDSLYTRKKNYNPLPLARQGEDKTAWFRNCKFGAFIHFGLYSLLKKGEWVMFKERIHCRGYAALANEFYAEQFDAEDLANIIQKAGMKYVVFTTRHHDGFCLYHSAVSDFNSMNSAAQRDLVAEYVEACRKVGLKIGFYYSPMDWRFPGYFFPELYYDSALAMQKQCFEQVRELMSSYGEIDILWYDGEWLAHGGIGWKSGEGEIGWYTPTDWMENPYYMKVNYFWESEALNRMVRELQPDILINNRSGWEGDFDVRERQIGEMNTEKPWESCGCLSESWGYVPGMPVLPLSVCIQQLVEIVVRDGNYLLNISPTESGALEDEHVQRLLEIGQWLSLYGESVYSTRGGPFLPEEWGGSCYRDNTVYIHILYPQGRTYIKLSKLDNQLLNAYSLNNEELIIEETDDSILISWTEEKELPDSIVVLEFKNAIQWEGVQEQCRYAYGLADGL